MVRYKAGWGVMVSLGPFGGCMTIVVGDVVGSPRVSSDGMGKHRGDTSSLSLSPYQFNGVVRGKKSSTVEKVVEMRQMRMIKKSAARSRARKQYKQNQDQCFGDQG